MKTFLRIFIFLALGAGLLRGQKVEQVRDLETDGAYPLDLTVAGGKLFFVFATKHKGEELWVSDGMGTHPAGNPAPAAPTDFRSIDGILYCSTPDGSIWRSDGTDAGTYRIYHGTSQYDYSFAVGKVGGRVIYCAKNKVWATDGSPMAVAQEIANVPSSQFAPAVIGQDGRLYFAGGDRAWASHLWSTDGTPAGTKDIGFINRDGIWDLASVGGYIFAKAGANNEAHIYRSDGTAQGTAIFDPVSPPLHSIHFFKTPGRLFFFDGASLCVTDGETAQVLRDNTPWVGYPPLAAIFNGTLYFNTSEDNNSVGLWKSDGTAAGTAPISGVNPMVYLPQSPNPSKPSHDVAAWNGYLYYFVWTADMEWSLWRWNEANGQTELVADLPDNLTAAAPRQLVVWNNALYFSAFDGREGRKLWRSDGTAAGTRVAFDEFSGSYTPMPGYLRAGENGKAYFLTRSQDFGTSILWRTDGTTQMTYPLIVGLVSPTDPEYCSFYVESQYTNVFEHKGVVYFTGHDGIHGHELWRTDGTAPGTFLIKDFYYGSKGFFDPVPQNFTVLHDTVYFAANDKDHGWQLWKTDGTVAGTVRISDTPGFGFHYLYSFRAVGDNLFFVADDGTHGGELWKSDGTRDGTMLVQDLAPGNDSSHPIFLGGLDGRLIFSANIVPALWTTDGTATGTHALTQAPANGGPGTAGFNYSFGSGLYKNKLFFNATDSAHGEELWVTDGRPEGTHLFKDIAPGKASSYAGSFTTMGDALYFTTSPAAGEFTLSKTFGTPEGTTVVAPIRASELKAAGGLLYFVSGDVLAVRRDLWRSDGTAAGTFALPINLLGASDPHYFLPLGDQVLFFAYDGFTGHELWRAGPEAAPEPSRFANISTRAHIGRGDSILIGGFIVTGTAPKRVAIRAIGSSLSGLIPDYLHDPRLRLFNSSGVEIAANDNWREQPSTSDLTVAGLAPTSNAEAAMVVTLQPGAYTAQVSGADEGTGIGLVEIYDLDQSADARAANISTRGLVRNDDDILIGGFIVQGSTPRRMTVRAIGPSLSRSGLPLSRCLADPSLEIYDANGARLAANDNWRDEQPEEIAAAKLSPADDLDACLIITLPAGQYTAQVRGNRQASGLALVEIYETQ